MHLPMAVSRSAASCRRPMVIFTVPRIRGLTISRPTLSALHRPGISVLSRRFHSWATCRGSLCRHPTDYFMEIFNTTPFSRPPLEVTCRIWFYLADDRTATPPYCRELFRLPTVISGGRARVSHLVPTASSMQLPLAENL